MFENNAVFPAAGPGPALRGSIDGQTGNAAVPSGAQSTVMLDSLPPFVLAYGLFCLWKFESRGNNDKPAKVPYNPRTLQRADSSNPSTFASADEVRDYQARGFDGVGLFIGNGISAIDIDHCITEQNCLTPLAQDVLNTMNGAYMEYSPSHRGIRILFYTPLDFVYDKNRYLINNQRLGLEIYVSQATSKYVSVTGWRFSSNPDLVDGSAQLMAVAEKYMLRDRPGATVSSVAPTQAMLVSGSDNEVVDAVMRSANGEAFAALMAGDMTACDNDHSRADMVFCNYLAAYTDNAEQIDRIMRTSGLMRDKWDRAVAGSTYGRNTVAKAIESAQQYRAGRVPTLPQEMMQALRSSHSQQTLPPVIQQQGVQQQGVQRQAGQQQALPPVISQQDVQRQVAQQQAQWDAEWEAQQAAQQAVLNDDDEAISARELQAMVLNPVEYVVEEILPAGLTIMAGPSKIKKSWMSLALSLNVATGEPFLDQQTHKGAVLYLALEDSRNRVKQRMNLILKNKLAPDNFYFRTKAPTIDEGLLETLEKELEKHPDIKLVIIDTFQKVRGVTRHGENAYGYDYREVSLLKGLADEHGIACILVHHTRKMVDESDPYKMISGTNGLMGSADATWVLLKNKRSDETACLHITGRDVREAELVVRFEDSIYQWVQVGTQKEIRMRDERRMVDESPVVQTILELLRESPTGTWEGTASKLLDAGATKMRVLAPNAMALGTQIKKLVPLMSTYAGVDYAYRTNGSAGHIHCFSLAQRGADGANASAGVQNEQAENGSSQG